MSKCFIFNSCLRNIRKGYSPISYKNGRQTAVDGDFGFGQRVSVGHMALAGLNGEAVLMAARTLANFEEIWV